VPGRSLGWEAILRQSISALNAAHKEAVRLRVRLRQEDCPRPQGYSSDFLYGRTFGGLLLSLWLFRRVPSPRLPCRGPTVLWRPPHVPEGYHPVEDDVVCRRVGVQDVVATPLELVVQRAVMRLPFRHLVEFGLHDVHHARLHHSYCYLVRTGVDISSTSKFLRFISPHIHSSASVCARSFSSKAASGSLFRTFLTAALHPDVLSPWKQPPSCAPDSPPSPHSIRGGD